MGLALKSPIVVSSCTLSSKLDNILKMEDAGAGAVVLFSLFEEQIRKENLNFDSSLLASNPIAPESENYFPRLDDYRMDSEHYLNIIRSAKERVDIPIIGSLNGISNDGWIEYAKDIEEAGADAIELNAYFIPGDFSLSSFDVENKYVDLVKHIKATVDIPVSLKLNPYFSSMGNIALLLDKAGSNALVLFNRFYQPDIDIYSLKVNANLEFSHVNEMRLPLLWISMLYGRTRQSLAATTGIQEATEIIKYLLAGADITMTASTLYKHGIEYINTLNSDLKQWMEEMHFYTLDDFKGKLSQLHIDDKTAYERANYLKVLGSA